MLGSLSLRYFEPGGARVRLLGCFQADQRELVMWLLPTARTLPYSNESTQMDARLESAIW
jgi:hypothetical protein